jgi:metal-responsive CopG/Arc/MetJ family transcriptional regulator
MRIVSVRLPDELCELIDQLAERQGSSRSELIRQAIEAYTMGRGWSVGALAADLAGAIEGPPDLSASSGSMAGYGK